MIIQENKKQTDENNSWFQSCCQTPEVHGNVMFTQTRAPPCLKHWRKKKKEVTSSQLPTNKAWSKLVWCRQGKKKNRRTLTGELGVSGHRLTAAVRQEIKKYSQVSLCTALHNTVSEKCGVVPLFCTCALSPYPLNSILPAWLDTDKVYKNTRCTLLWAALT